jgi:hypothetical protein
VQVATPHSGKYPGSKREREITYSEEWGGDLSPTGQPGFSTLLSFLKKQNIRINIYGYGMNKK